MSAARLQSFLRAVAAPGRTVLDAAPFTAYLDPQDPLRFLNYAIPDDGAEPELTSVDRLRVVFHEHARLPRLEWIEEVAPRVAPVLAEAGMTEELSAPLMACAPGELLEPRSDVDDLTVAPVQDTDLRDSANLQRVAFGHPPLDAEESPPDPRRHGGGGVLARASGEPVAAANWTPVVDGITEIAGVATSEAWRRRRLAGVVTAAAARAAFSAGAERCILSPGDEIAQRVYERAGFRRVATILHWSDPD